MLARLADPSNSIWPRALLGKPDDKGCADIAALLRALFEECSQAILVVDARGKVLVANRRATKIFGFRQDDLLGKPLGFLLPKPNRMEYGSRRSRYFLDSKKKQNRTKYELIGRRADGGVFPAEVILRGIDLSSRRLLLAFISDISEGKQVEDEITRIHRELRDVRGQLISVQEEFKKLIARELHDVVNQQVAIIARRVNGLREWGQRFTSELDGILLQIRAGINTLAGNVHDFARHLHPSILYDLGLMAALERESVSLQRQYGIPITLAKGRGIPKRVPDPAGLALYRIAQEAIRNAVRHAHPHHIRLALAIRDKQLLLVVADDGRGFDPQTGRRKGGLGLISMEDRVRLAGGGLRVSSRPGKGTRIEAHIPLDRFQK